MSQSVDNKVVSMQFDHSQFKTNVMDTINMLNKLKDSLKLPGASKGLAEVDQAAKQCDVGALGRAAETVQTRFSAMQAIAVGALMNIGAQAVNTGANMLKSLTIAPITDGFREYETQMNSVQTILANTSHQGTTLEDVSAALDELNTYADQTIYNFTEMTRNIGTFTAAGVDLDTSTSAIKGIANLAAVSGSTSQQASTAMYQLSQALAAGRVSLMDWNSVVNAGMGGKVFQNALIKTSEMMGTGAEDAIKKFGSFRESLTQGEWLTTDVLTQTLKQFTMAAEEGSEEWIAYKKELKDMGYTEKQAEEILKMANTATDAATKVKTFTQLMDTLKEAVGSGWAQTWKILFGDFEEAKALWTGVSDTLGAVINKTSEARNTLLKNWKDLGGRTDIIEGFKNIWEAIVSIVKPITEAFRDIFPPITAKKLKEFSEGFKKLTSHFILGETASKNLKDTFKGLFSIFDIFRMVLGGVFKAIKPVFGVFDNAGGGILAVTGAIGRFITKIHDVIEKLGLFNKIGGVVATVLETVKSVIKSFTDAVGELNIIDRVKDKFSGLADAIKLILFGTTDLAGKNPIVAFIESIWNALSTVGGKIVDAVKTIFGSIKEAFSGDNAFGALTDIFNVGVLGAIAIAIAKFTKSVGNGFGIFDSITGAFDGLKESFEGVTGILDGVKGSLETWQQSLRAEMLMDIAKAVALLAGALFVIAMIDSDKLASSLAAVATLFTELMLAMSAFTKLDATGVKTTLSIMSLVGVATAVLILALALRSIANLNFKQMATGVAGIAGLTTIIVAAATVLNKCKGKIMKGAGQIVIFALAIKILAGVCEDLAALSWTDMVQGLIGVGALIGAVSIFLKTAKIDAKAKATCAGVLLLAVAIKILSSACKDFAAMRVEDIIKSLGSIGVLLGMLGIFTKVAGGTGGMVSTGIGLAVIGASMLIFADAVKKLGAINIEDLIKGLGGMAVALVIITSAMKSMPTGSMVGAGVSMLIIANAMVVLTEAIGNMGGMRWQDLAQGLLGLGAAMVIMAVGLKAMNGTLAGSAALLVASTALGILGGVINTLGEMRWQDLAKGLGAIAAAFVILGVAGAVLAPLIPAILALGAALALIGTGVAAFGVGVMAIGTGLTLVAAGFVALAGSAAAIIKVLEFIAVAAVKFAPMLGAALAGAIAGFCKAIDEALPVIGSMFTELVLTMLDILNECAPPLVSTLMNLLSLLVEKIVEYTPKFAKAAFDIVVSILDTIANNIGRIVQSGADIIVNFLKGLAGEIGRIVTAAIDIIIAFVNGIAQNIGRVVQAGFDLIISFINGLTNAINENTPVIVEAMRGLILALINAAVTVLTGGIGLFFDAGLMIMDGGLIQGLAAKAGEVKEKIGNAIGSGLKAVTNKAGEFLSGGKKLFESVINGIGSKLGALKTKSGTVIKNGLKAVTGKAGEFLSAGKQLFQSVINGIGSKLGSLTGKAGELINAAKNRVSSFSLVQVGRDLIQGLINGIGEKANALVEKARGVVNNAIQAAKNLLGIKSPSRVFMKFGRYVDEGFIIGLQQMAGKVTKTTEDVGKGAINGMASVISRIGDSVNSDIDVNPTITPVIDLTEVQNGITRMNSMFNGRTVSMSASIDSAVDRTSSLNGSSDASSSIVDAINRLRTDISNMKTTENNLNFNGTVFNDDDRINSLMVSLLTELARKGAMGIG